MVLIVFENMHIYQNLHLYILKVLQNHGFYVIWMLYINVFMIDNIILRVLEASSIHIYIYTYTTLYFLKIVSCG